MMESQMRAYFRRLLGLDVPFAPLVMDTLEANPQVGKPGFNLGWTGTGVSGGPLHVRKIGGMVEFEGAVYKNSPGTFETCMTLPAEYRPAKTCSFTLSSGAHTPIGAIFHVSGEVVLRVVLPEENPGFPDLRVATYLQGARYRA